MAPKEKQKIEIEKTHGDPLLSFNQAVTVDCSDFLGTALIQLQQVLGFDTKPGPCIRLVRLLYRRRTSVLWKLHLWHRQQIAWVRCGSLSRSLHVWHAAGVSVGLTQEVRPCGVWRLGRSSARRQSAV